MGLTITSSDSYTSSHVRRKKSHGSSLRQEKVVGRIGAHRFLWELCEGRGRPTQLLLTAMVQFGRGSAAEEKSGGEHNRPKKELVPSQRRDVQRRDLRTGAIG